MAGTLSSSSLSTDIRLIYPYGYTDGSVSNLTDVQGDYLSPYFKVPAYLNAVILDGVSSNALGRYFVRRNNGPDVEVQIGVERDLALGPNDIIQFYVKGETSLNEIYSYSLGFRYDPLYANPDFSSSLSSSSTAVDGSTSSSESSSTQALPSSLSSGLSEPSSQSSSSSSQSQSSISESSTSSDSSSESSRYKSVNRLYVVGDNNRGQEIDIFTLLNVSFERSMDGGGNSGQGIGGIEGRLFHVNRGDTVFELNLETMNDFTSFSAPDTLTGNIGGIKDRLYAMSSSPNTIYEIDPDIGTIYNSVPYSYNALGSGIGGMYDDLYVVNNSIIDKIDPEFLIIETSNSTSFNFQGVGGVGELLYCVDSVNIYQIDPVTYIILNGPVNPSTMSSFEDIGGIKTSYPVVYESSSSSSVNFTYATTGAGTITMPDFNAEYNGQDRYYLSFRIKLTSNNTVINPIYEHVDDISGDGVIVSINNDNRIRLQFIAGGALSNNFTTTALTVGDWSFVHITRYGSTIRCYIDNVQRFSGSFNTNNFNFSNTSTPTITCYNDVELAFFELADNSLSPGGALNLYSYLYNNGISRCWEGLFPSDAFDYSQDNAYLWMELCNYNSVNVGDEYIDKAGSNNGTDSGVSLIETDGLVIECDPNSSSSTVNMSTSSDSSFIQSFSRLYCCDTDTDLIYELNIDDKTVLSSASTPSAVPYGIGGIENRLYHCESSLDRIYELNIGTKLQISNVSSPSTFPTGIGGIMNRLYHCDTNSDLIYELDVDFKTAITSASSPGLVPQGIGGTENRLYHCDTSTDLIYELDVVSKTLLKSVASPDNVIVSIGGIVNELYVSDVISDLIYELDIETLLSLNNYPTPGTNTIGIGGVKYSPEWIFDSSSSSSSSSSSQSSSSSSSSFIQSFSRLYCCDPGVDLTYEINKDDKTVINSASSPNILPYGIGGIENRLYHCDANSDLIYELNIGTKLQISNASSPDLSPSGIGGIMDRLYHCDSGIDLIYELNIVTKLQITSASSPGITPQGIGGTENRLYHCDPGVDNIYELDVVSKTFLKSAPAPSAVTVGIGGIVNGLYASDANTDLIYDLDIETLVSLNNYPAPSTGVTGIGGVKYSPEWIFDSSSSSSST